MPDDYSQPWWKSKTIRVSIAGILVALGNMLNKQHADAESLLTILTALGAIYGRITAAKPIAGTAACTQVNQVIQTALMTPPPTQTRKAQ